MNHCTYREGLYTQPLGTMAQTSHNQIVYHCSQPNPCASSYLFAPDVRKRWHSSYFMVSR